jgi:hypothetical protein
MSVSNAMFVCPFVHVTTCVNRFYEVHIPNVKQLSASTWSKQQSLKASKGTLKLCFITFPSSLHIIHCLQFFVDYSLVVKNKWWSSFWSFMGLGKLVFHYAALHTLTFWAPFWNTLLITSNDAAEKVWVGVIGWDEFFITYDTVRLLLFRETVEQTSHRSSSFPSFWKESNELSLS